MRKTNPYNSLQLRWTLMILCHVREDRQEDMSHYTYMRYREEAGSLGRKHRVLGDERKNRRRPLSDE